MLQLTTDDSDVREQDDITTAESIFAFSAAIATTFLTRRLLMIAWQKAFDREPPKNPASSEVAWREAILWGAISGAFAGLARIVGRRAASGSYHHFHR